MKHGLTCALAPFAFAALALCLPAAAHAETTPACPADAEQTLYDMEMAVRLGQQKDPAPVLELAEWAIETCPERPDAQAIAATLASAVLGTTNEPETLERYLTLTFTAITQNDYAWNTKQKPSVLKQPDGGEQNYFGYNSATTTLLQFAIPFTITLAEAGQLHPVISGAPYESCPFADHANFRLQEEANLWDRAVKTRFDHPGFGWAENRLTALYAACPAHKNELDFYLARLYGQEIERLTRWDYNDNDLNLYALDDWYWHNPIKGDINGKSKMEEAKAELDAIAGPLAEKARPHIASLKQTPHDQIQIYHGQLDKVEDWDKALKRLDSEAIE